MSEYWVSHKKYFCKYCNIYIADDAPSRNHHEGGMRHKGNVERFVRGLYKSGEKRKQDLEEEKREMAHIEKAAQAAFAQDVGAGLVKPGSSSTTAPPKEAGPSKPVRKTDLYSDYSTAASLGYTDLDAERLNAEAERRRKEGVAGDWELIAVEEPSTATEVENIRGHAAVPIPVQREADLKREAETQLDEEDTRAFKLRKKKLGAGMGEIYDPGIVPIKLKVKKEEAADELTTAAAKGSQNFNNAFAPGNSAATSVPKWSARGWSKPGTQTEDRPDDQSHEEQSVEGGKEPASQEGGLAKEESYNGVPLSDARTKTESPSTSVKLEEVAKSEELEPAAPAPSRGGLFRKRKLPVGGAGSRGRRE
ncbi:hypothetical protein PHLCEN_2v8413 [Hermanssonia centrifuga]|uniref:Matrin-type domain-containing protein n=1 Tax=Hermanssonia centrifuga TaxID=98765 RepID=A0A2R6NTR1_9APHY|nr:hypothetical protein PHLCEN_2v8413 [Hermanssonia centrifuga]